MAQSAEVYPEKQAGLGTPDETNPFPPESAFLKGLPQADLEILAAAAKKRDWARGEHLFLQGDAADRLFVIVSGWIRLYQVAPDGRETVAGMLTRGAVLGESAVFDKTCRNSAQAAEPSTVIEIPASILAERVKVSPELMARVAAELARKLEAARLDIEHSTLKTALQRVGCLLLRLTAGMTGRGGAFTFPYDKKIAAQQLGMQRETFSRALTGLRPMGVSVKGSETGIDDFYRLTEYVCRNCTAYPGRCAGPRVEATTKARSALNKLYLFLGGAWCDVYSSMLELF